jgi:hypothetical protein
VILAAPSPLEFENPINIEEIPPEGQSCPKPESPDFHFQPPLKPIGTRGRDRPGQAAAN